MNKSILKELMSIQHSLVTRVLLVYRKIIDSILRSCLIYSLKLGKCPNHLLIAIKSLTESRYTALNLYVRDNCIVPDITKKRGISQGDQ